MELMFYSLTDEWKVYWYEAVSWALLDLRPSSCVLMVLSVSSCLTPHRCTHTPSHFPASPCRTDCVPAGRRRCNTQTCTDSHESNAWLWFLLSQHAPWLPGCCPTNNSCYYSSGLEVPLHEDTQPHTRTYVHMDSFDVESPSKQTSFFSDSFNLMEK